MYYATEFIIRNPTNVESVDSCATFYRKFIDKWNHIVKTKNHPIQFQFININKNDLVTKQEIDFKQFYIKLEHFDSIIKEMNYITIESCKEPLYGQYSYHRKDNYDKDISYHSIISIKLSHRIVNPVLNLVYESLQEMNQLWI